MGDGHEGTIEMTSGSFYRRAALAALTGAVVLSTGGACAAKNTLDPKAMDQLVAAGHKAVSLGDLDASGGGSAHHSTEDLTRLLLTTDDMPPDFRVQSVNSTADSTEPSPDSSSGESGMSVTNVQPPECESVAADGLGDELLKNEAAFGGSTSDGTTLVEELVPWDKKVEQMAAQMTGACASMTMNDTFDGQTMTLTSTTTETDLPSMPADKSTGLKMVSRASGIGDSAELTSYFAFVKVGSYAVIITVNGTGNSGSSSGTTTGDDATKQQFDDFTTKAVEKVAASK